MHKYTVHAAHTTASDESDWAVNMCVRVRDCVWVWVYPCSLQVVLHPKWGSAVYPATLFSTAPLDELTAAIHAAGAETSKA